MESGIYSITCLDNGKRYIGSAINIKSRWDVHKCRLNKGNHHSIHLQRAWQKHGSDKFRFEVIEFCGRGDLIEREQHHLDLYKPFGENGYNISPRAGHTLGAKRTPEQIEKMASKHRGKKLSDEHKRKISEAARGRKHRPESIEKMRAAARRLRTQSGRELTEKQKAALHKSGESHPWFGRKHSQETRAILSQNSIKYSVQQIGAGGEVIKVWGSAKMAADELGLRGPDTIYRAVCDTSRKAAGFHWRRLTDRAIVS